MSKPTHHPQTLRDIREHIDVLQALARDLRVTARLPLEGDTGLAVSAIADLSAFHLTRSAELLDCILSLCASTPTPQKKPTP